MGRRFLLDTSIVVTISRTGGFETLPSKVRRILQDSNSDLLLSVASQAEIAIKTSIGKLDLTKEELSLVCANASIDLYPLREHHIWRLFQLPLLHRDPFDRLIIATAFSDDLPVLTSDNQFGKYKGLRVIW